MVYTFSYTFGTYPTFQANRYKVFKRIHYLRLCNIYRFQLSMDAKTSS